MKKEKVCVICGKTFETEYSNKKYCSLICRDASIRKKRLEWKMNNPNYYRDYSRMQRSKDEPIENSLKRCKVCGGRARFQLFHYEPDIMKHFIPNSLESEHWIIWVECGNGCDNQSHGFRTDIGYQGIKEETNNDEGLKSAVKSWNENN